MIVTVMTNIAANAMGRLDMYLIYTDKNFLNELSKNGFNRCQQVHMTMVLSQSLEDDTAIGTMVGVF